MRKFAFFILVIMAALLAAGQAWTAEEGTAQYYLEQGEEHVKRGNLDQAITDFNQALEIYPSYAVAYNNRGNAYYGKGQYDQAITDYNRALEINPKLAVAYNNRAVAFYFKKSYDRAWEDLRKAQSLGYKVDPGDFETLRKASEREQ